MKALINIVILFTIMYLLLNSNTYAQNRKVPLVKLEWQNFSTQTFYDVDYNSFRSLFKGTIEK